MEHYFGLTDGNIIMLGQYDNLESAVEVADAYPTPVIWVFDEEGLSDLRVMIDQVLP